MRTDYAHFIILIYIVAYGDDGGEIKWREKKPTHTHIWEQCIGRIKKIYNDLVLPVSVSSTKRYNKWRISMVLLLLLFEIHVFVFPFSMVTFFAELGCSVSIMDMTIFTHIGLWHSDLRDYLYIYIHIYKSLTITQY